MGKRLQNLTELIGVVVEAASPQPRSPEQLQAGQRAFAAQCGFCHGRDAMGGETGPNLTRSAIVADDVGGDKIGPVIRDGRADKGMPPFRLSDADLAAIVAFIHDQKIKSESPGARRSVNAADLQTGNADAGRQYFNGAGRCATCHSPTGDLAGVAKRLQGLELLQRMLTDRDDRPHYQRHRSRDDGRCGRRSVEHIIDLDVDPASARSTRPLDGCGDISRRVRSV